MKLKTKLQLGVIIPLFAAILLCTIITLVILGVQHRTWFNRLHDYIIDEEKDSLERRSQTKAYTVSYFYNSRIRALRFLNGVYGNYLSGDLELNGEYTYDNSALNAYSTLGKNYNFPDEANAVYAMPKRTDLSSSIASSSIRSFDLFARIIWNKEAYNNSFYSAAFGADGLDYRYPHYNMSFVGEQQDYIDTCDYVGTYDVRCTVSYKLMQSNKLSAYYEHEYLSLFYMTDEGAMSEYLDPLEIDDILPRINNDYDVFLSGNDGSYVLSYNQEPIESYWGKTLSEVLFNDKDSRKAYDSQIVSDFDDDDLIEKEFDEEEYYVSAAPVKVTYLEDEEVTVLELGMQISEEDTLDGYEDLIQVVLVNILIQMAVFIFFLILVIVASWRLYRFLVQRIVNPITYAADIISKEKKEVDTREYNYEINEIIKVANTISTLERFIDPRFFKNPDLDDKLENLQLAKDTLRSVNNERGVAILSSLIGNIHFGLKQYKDAADSYEESFNAMKALKAMLQKELDEEKQMNEEDRQKLKEKMGEEYDDNFWNDELQALDEAISERDLLIGMAKAAWLEEQVNLEWTSAREEWQNVLGRQISALQHYTSSKSHYVRILKLLVDMAHTFHKLHYFHSSLEILDIVRDELWKLRFKGSLHIDINRIRSIGVEVNDTRRTVELAERIDTKNDIEYVIQLMHYQKALVLKDEEKYPQAAAHFNMSLEEPQVLDASVRDKALQELADIFLRFELMDEAPELTHLLERKTTKGICMLVAYNWYLNLESNRFIQSFVEQNINPAKHSFGATTLYEHSNLNLSLTARDNPAKDIEELFNSMKPIDQRPEAIGDSIIRAAQMTQGYRSRTLIVFVGDFTSTKSAAIVDDLYSFFKTGEVRLITVGMDLTSPTEFRSFVEDSGLLIQCENAKHLETALQHLAKQI